MSSKPKTKGTSKKPSRASINAEKSGSTAITDSRFSSIQNDPRFRLPSKRTTRVKVDKRFSHMLKDDDFTRKAKVDRYGRQLETDSERNRLKRKYEFDDEDQADDDDDVQAELQRIEKKYDPIRDGGYSSSEESSSDESDIEEEPEELDQAAQSAGVPMGEVSTRVAVVNLDWDHIRAEDLMAVFSSFVPTGERLQKVVVYPSEFGKERMEREEMEGPPRELFAKSGQDSEDDGPDEDRESIDSELDDEDIKKSIVKDDNGEEFDSTKLRKYQLERLRYFYAVLTFSSKDAAKAVYDAVDGTEYLSTANFFDLRFVPDDTDFSEDKPRDECESMPEGYKPNEFVTDALQHSKVKLTWDADDPARKEAQAKAFRGSRKDIDENDLKAYLGSDSSDSEDEPEEEAPAAAKEPDSNLSKKEKEKQRLRALLGLGSAPAKKSKTDGPIGGVQITFSSGLTGGDKKTSVFANDPIPDETTVEKYVRKERERKQKRKNKMKGIEDEAEADEVAATTAEQPAEEDLGFDDPFFAEPENDKATATALRKAERKKKREERAREEQATAAQRAELELLMVDDKAANIKHFNMNDIERAEKKSKKKGKKGGKKGDNDDAEAILAEDNFQIDVADPRFTQLYNSHEYAIDPTNSKFKSTKGMKALLEEGRKRRRLDDGEGQSREERRLQAKASKSATATTAEGGNKSKASKKTSDGEGHGEDLSKLIQKVKAKGAATASK